MSTQNIDVLRRKLQTLNVLFLAERDRCAKKAGAVETGQLATSTGKWEHESLLREMILYDQNAQTIEAMMKGLY